MLDMGGYRFDSFSKCACGAITFYAKAIPFSCREENVHDYFGDATGELDLSEVEQLGDTDTCCHCADHCGLDLCACGSGLPADKCNCGTSLCGKPMQSFVYGYTRVRRNNTKSVFRVGEISESDLKLKYLGKYARQV